MIFFLWTDFIYLTNSSCYIHEPLNFDSSSDIIKQKKYITLSHWEFLFIILSTLGIVPPIIPTLINTKSSTNTLENCLKNKVS